MAPVDSFSATLLMTYADPLAPTAALAASSSAFPVSKGSAPSASEKGTRTLVAEKRLGCSASAERGITMASIEEVVRLVSPSCAGSESSFPTKEMVPESTAASSMLV